MTLPLRMDKLNARRALEIALVLLLITGGAQEHTRRLERAAERQILQSLGGTGQVKVHIRPQWGTLGVLLARAESIHVHASGFRVARMPFFTDPAVPAWRGEARTVRIVLEHFHLSGLPVRYMEATIPRVSLDSRAAAFDLRIRLFEAGWGESLVVLDEAGLAECVKRRLPEVRVAQVEITPSGIRITGELVALLSPWRFEATGRLEVRNGQCIVIDRVQVSLEGAELASAIIQKVTSAINPLLDIERDLQLGTAFVLERVEQGSGLLRLIGRATVPPHDSGGEHDDRRQ
jgi:hypothetical protein